MGGKRVPPRASRALGGGLDALRAPGTSRCGSSRRHALSEAMILSSQSAGRTRTTVRTRRSATSRAARTPSTCRGRVGEPGGQPRCPAQARRRSPLWRSGGPTVLTAVFAAPKDTATAPLAVFDRRAPPQPRPEASATAPSSGIRRAARGPPLVGLRRWPDTVSSATAAVREAVRFEVSAASRTSPVRDSGRRPDPAAPAGYS